MVAYTYITFAINFAMVRIINLLRNLDCFYMCLIFYPKRITYPLKTFRKILYNIQKTLFSIISFISNQRLKNSNSSTFFYFMHLIILKYTFFNTQKLSYALLQHVQQKSSCIIYSIQRLKCEKTIFLNFIEHYCCLICEASSIKRNQASSKKLSCMEIRFTLGKEFK